MHELSVAAGIFDIVQQHVAASQGSLVRTVRVRIGEAAAVLPESLEFCFGAIVMGTPYGHASLAIERTAGDELQVVDVEVDDGVKEPQ
jgi:hydrogenase nickel incorporation protein HypA/HybF